MLSLPVLVAGLVLAPGPVPRAAAPVSRAATPLMAAAADDFVPDMQRRTIMNLVLLGGAAGARSASHLSLKNARALPSVGPALATH